MQRDAAVPYPLQVVDGHAAKEHQFPWAVAVLFVNRYDGWYTFFDMNFQIADTRTLYMYIRLQHWNKVAVER